MVYIYNQFVEKPAMFYFGLIMCSVGWHPLQSPDKCLQYSHSLCIVQVITITRSMQSEQNIAIF